MLIIGYFKPKSADEIAKRDERVTAAVDMTPWSQAKNV